MSFWRKLEFLLLGMRFVCLSSSSREKVDAMVAPSAASVGGATYNEPQDHSFISLSPMDSGEAAQSSNRDV
jgi:hypothetical protein